MTLFKSFTLSEFVAESLLAVVVRFDEIAIAGLLVVGHDRNDSKVLSGVEVYVVGLIAGFIGLITSELKRTTGVRLMIEGS